MALWPPTLAQLKADADLLGDDRSDAQLQTVLDSAIAFVERVHAGRINFAYTLGSALPLPDANHALGAIRLARRWDQRRQSPDGLIAMADVANRVPNFDADIERLLRIGRFAPATFA